MLSGKRCIKEQENDENLPTAKRGSCIKLFEAVAVATPFKERNFQNEFNFFWFITYFSTISKNMNLLHQRNRIRLLMKNTALLSHNAQLVLELPFVLLCKPQVTVVKTLTIGISNSKTPTITKEESCKEII